MTGWRFEVMQDHDIDQIASGDWDDIKDSAKRAGIPPDEYLGLRRAMLWLISSAKIDIPCTILKSETPDFIVCMNESRKIGLEITAATSRRRMAIESEAAKTEETIPNEEKCSYLIAEDPELYDPSKGVSRLSPSSKRRLSSHIIRDGEEITGDGWAGDSSMGQSVNNMIFHAIDAKIARWKPAQGQPERNILLVFGVGWPTGWHGDFSRHPKLGHALGTAILERERSGPFSNILIDPRIERDHVWSSASLLGSE